VKRKKYNYVARDGRQDGQKMGEKAATDKKKRHNASGAAHDAEA